DASQGYVTLLMVITGIGIGPSMPLYTLAIQNAVDVRKLGQATSASQFFRQIGGAVGTAIFGTVLSVTLATAFATNLASVGPGVAAAPQGFSAEGGAGSGGITDSVRSAFNEGLATVIAAVDAGDEAALASALTSAGVPPQGQQGILADLAASAESPEARTAFKDELVAQFEQQADAVVAQVDRGVKLSFTQAVTRIYSYVVFIVA